MRQDTGDFTQTAGFWAFYLCSNKLYMALQSKIMLDSKVLLAIQNYD